MNQQKELASEYIENEYDLAYETTDPPSSTVIDDPFTEYYQYDEIESDCIGGEYVLPSQDRKIIQSESQLETKVETKKNTVQDLYDEDNYALPNIDGCVTRTSGVMDIDGCVTRKSGGMEEVRHDKRTKTASSGAERIHITMKMKITGIIILLLVLVIFCGILLAIVTEGTNPTTDLGKKCVDDIRCGTEVVNKIEECHDLLIKEKCPKLCETC